MGCPIVTRCSGAVLRAASGGLVDGASGRVTTGSFWGSMGYLGLADE